MSSCDANGDFPPGFGALIDRHEFLERRHDEREQPSMIESEWFDSSFARDGLMADKTWKLVQSCEG